MRANQKAVHKSSAALAVLFSVGITGLFTLAACTSQNQNSCPAEQSDCDGTCRNLSAEPDHCGSCGTACGGEQVCSQGACKSDCSEGLVNCSRSCVDTAVDAANCGSCGMHCAAGATCQSGRCMAVVAECKDRLNLQSTGAYDVAFKTVQISGRLTKNGATLPDGINRGSLLFVAKRGGSRAMPAFTATGEATYAGEVFAGTYDISYQPSIYCKTGEALPCQQVLLRSDVDLTQAGALDFDIKTVQVSGKLTKNGARVADDVTDRGYLSFTMVNGGSRVMPSFGVTGEATYLGELVAGTYDVSYQSSTYCKTGGALPCQQLQLRAGAALTASGALDFDVKTVQVSGKLTKNGVRVADDVTDRGYLIFTLQNGNSRAMPSFGVTGEATYLGELFAGTYDIRYQQSVYCKNGGAIPCQSIVLRTKAAIGASGALDFDVKTVQVSGKLTKNGVRVADDVTDRGSLIFTLLTGSARSMPPFGVSGEATYMGEVFAGTYDISYQPGTYCKNGGAIPCQSVALRTKVALSASGALDFDAKTVQISGALTKNGAAVADDTVDRGYLVFSLLTGGTRTMPAFGVSGAAQYMGEIFAGTYDIRYQPSVYCKNGGALPCESLILRTGNAIMSSGALDFDAKAVTVSGAVTKNGAAVPDDVTDRGSLVFGLAPQAGSRSMPPFGVSGAASYKGEVWAGAYDVTYQPNIYCKNGGALPCQSTLVVGCPPPTTMP